MISAKVMAPNTTMKFPLIRLLLIITKFNFFLFIKVLFCYNLMYFQPILFKSFLKCLLCYALFKYNVLHIFSKFTIEPFSVMKCVIIKSKNMTDYNV